MEIKAGYTWSIALMLILFLFDKTNAAPVDFASCPIANVDDHCPDNKYIKVYIFTRTNPDEGQLLVSDNVTLSFFDISKPTKIIIHGFASDYNLFALIDMRKAYLTEGDYNVLAIDWSDYSGGPITCYPAAIHNGRRVGKCLADFIQRLRDIKAVQKFHVIGFSLGAHVASFVANNLRPYRLPRITGLDPAMPLFVTSNVDSKLDAGDAIFVDVVHTNAFVQGKIEESGHVDFYVNGGSSQPGCDSSGCSHVRAVQYFAETINSPAGFYGWPCSGYFAYILGLCPWDPPTMLMGQNVSQKLRGYVLVKTAAKAPFALGKQVAQKTN